MRLDQTTACTVIVLRHQLHDKKPARTYDASMGRYDTTYEELLEWLAPLFAQAIQVSADADQLLRHFMALCSTGIIVAVEHVTNGELATAGGTVPAEALEVIRTARALAQVTSEGAALENLTVALADYDKTREGVEDA